VQRRHVQIVFRNRDKYYTLERIVRRRPSKVLNAFAYIPPPNLVVHHFKPFPPLVIRRLRRLLSRLPYILSPVPGAYRIHNNMRHVLNMRARASYLTVLIISRHESVFILVYENVPRRSVSYAPVNARENNNRRTVVNFFRPGVTEGSCGVWRAACTRFLHGVRVRPNRRSTEF